MRKEFRTTEKPIPVDKVDNTQDIRQGFITLIKSNAKITRSLEKEKEKSEKWGNDLLLDILDIADSLERTILHAEELPKHGDIDKIVGHLHSTAQQLAWILKRRGVTSFDTVGKTADPATTTIMEEEERSDCQDDEVIRETAKGYLYKGQLLRRARVIVARNKETK
jgi:molecular chaperone GrpE (heat shock protein)